MVRSVCPVTAGVIFVIGCSAHAREPRGRARRRGARRIDGQPEVLNERGYVERGQKVNAAYRTYHGTRVAASTTTPSTPPPNGYPFEVRMPAHEVTWSWACRDVDGRAECAAGMRHFWLEPIFVRGPRGRE